MKKYILLSLLIHGLLFLLTMQQVKKQSNIKQEQQQQQSGDKGKTNLGSQAVEIIELVDQITEQSTKPKQELKRFYWGIGITGDIVNGYYVVSSISRGYTAERSNLQIGDIIAEVDHKALTFQNDIAGDGPKKLVLTIVRNGNIIYISIERTKVYY